MVSVIVACVGPSVRIRRCLAAVLRHSRRPWELIAVARGEAPVIGSYLAGVRDAASIPVRIIDEPGPRGPRAAWARGLAEARGIWWRWSGRRSW